MRARLHKRLSKIQIRYRSRFNPTFFFIRYGLSRAFSSMLGSFRGNKVHAFWYNNRVNFGDLFTPVLLKQLGLTPVHSQVGLAEVVSTGSILDELQEDYSGYILGSGLRMDTVRIFKQAKVLAVRGALTRDRIGAPQSTLLGDPGLLASTLLKKRSSKQYTLGLIPHYVDKRDERIHKISRRYSKEILVIDVERQPVKVIADLDKCDYILSSSLHGLIVADSLGIPNAWLHLSDGVVGNGFKFHDYASALGYTYQSHSLTGDESMADLIKITHSVSGRTPEIKQNLDAAFYRLRNEILSPY